MAFLKSKSSKSAPVDASARTISFDEARAIARMPTEADTAALQAKNSRGGFTLGETYRVVENCAAESEYHQELCANIGKKITELSRRPERSDVMLVLDTTNGLLFACIPRWVDGKLQPGMYNRLSQDWCKVVYSGLAAGYARAWANNNIEVVDGVERFCYPSALLNSGRPKAKESTPSLGASALASSSANANAVLMASARGMTADEHSKAALDVFMAMCDDVEATRQAIVDGLDADNADDVCGIVVGHVPSDNRGFTTMSTTDGKTPDYDGCHTLNAQFIDETNAAIAGATSSLGAVHRKRRVPIVAEKSSPAVVIDDNHNPPLHDSPSFVPSSPSNMSSKSSSSAAASAAAAAAKPSKSSSSAPASSTPVANKKRTSDVASDDVAIADARKLLRAQLPALTTGLFDPELRKACLGRYAEGDTAPAFILAGKQLAPKLSDVATVGRMSSYIGTITDKGAEGMQAPERAYVTKATFDSALFAEVDGTNIPVDKKAAIIKACPLAGLQFFAGLLAGGLSADIDKQLDAVVTNVIVPMTEKAAKADAAAEEARAEIAKLRAQLDEIAADKAKADQEAAARKAAEEEEAARKAKEAEVEMVVADVSDW